MNKKGKVIAGLFLLGFTLFSIVQFVIIPKQEAAAEKYREEQKSPLTHDLEYILPYKHPYMGNAGNLANLFGHLPLSEAGIQFELKSEELTALIFYQKPASEFDPAFLNQSIIYNSTAAFSLIGNLEKIEYHFTDESIVVTRERIENIYDEFAELTTSPTVWNKKVQSPLRDGGYVKETMEGMREQKS